MASEQPVNGHSRRRGDSMSWRAVADELASRLCLVEPCGARHWPPDLEGCPFCKDAEALRLYVEKGGDVRTPTFDGRVVSIQQFVKEQREAESHG